jgi:hypothetical protein
MTTASIMVDVYCANCDKRFSVRRNQRRKYCSQKCARAGAKKHYRSKELDHEVSGDWEKKIRESARKQLSDLLRVYGERDFKNQPFQEFSGNL